MEKRRICDIDDPAFAEFWEIYEYSFPDSEKRTISHQHTALKNPQYELMCYVEDGNMVGFVGCWNMDDYLYVEHLAVSRSVRGGGYGSKIMRELMASEERIVILEIDDVVDDVSERRLRFYEHLGFRRNPYPHKGHRYKDHGEVPDHEVLTYPVPVSEEFYDRFNDDLGNIVMKK